jgi:glycerol-3-phosphate dehydrogenase (NAD(P)+)
VGDGGWGTALALVLESCGHGVTVWSHDEDYCRRMERTRTNPRYLPDVPLPGSLKFSAEMGECVPGADMLVSAVPTQFLRGVAERLSGHLQEGQPVVTVTKGIEEETSLPGSGVLRETCGEDFPLAGLFGPSHAEEVARRQPTTVVATSRDGELARRVQEAFLTPVFRVYTNTDMLGVELGAALKNVIALAAGMCDGLDFGDNAKSALITRGLAEMVRLGVAMGAEAETFAGLTGLGDLITTCVSPHGRNRSVGMRIGRGEKVDEIVSGMDQVAEGVRTTRSACALAGEYGVEMPITRAVHAILFEGLEPREAVTELMTRSPKPERYGDR